MGLLVAALMVACMMLAANPAHAKTFTVDRKDDPDPAYADDCTVNASDCSLRGAIIVANAASGPDEITVPEGTYTLTRAGAFEDASKGDLNITGDLTITGAGARTTSVAGGATPFDDRIFDNLTSVKATITGLTITGGKAAGGAGGGGVYNQGDLTLDKVAVKDNTALAVGGIYGSGGTLNPTDSTVSGNSVTGTGNVGGVAQEGGTANITNSTISGNKAAQDRFGGGVYAQGSLVKIRNSTIASNESGRLGGGIVTAIGTTLFVKNTIVAGNTLDNCDTAVYGGAITSQGNNISSDSSCNFTQSTDKRNTDPRLGPLQDNGGPTDTRALLAGSPAIDAGTNTDCPDADQRGVDRPQGTACDVGAVEGGPIGLTVDGTTPATGATGVPLNISPTATFSKEMNETTLTSSTFQLYKGQWTRVKKKKGKKKRWVLRWVPVSASVSYNTASKAATLDPASNLAANATYLAVVTTGVKDKAGNALARNYSWTFTTASS